MEHDESGLRWLLAEALEREKERGANGNDGEEARSRDREHIATARLTAAQDKRVLKAGLGLFVFILLLVIAQRVFHFLGLPF